ncbi:hypothetical protein Tco_1546579 [Tanacetum coccineum]
MYIRNDPSFFLTNKIGAPQGAATRASNRFGNSSFRAQSVEDPASLPGKYFRKISNDCPAISNILGNSSSWGSSTMLRAFLRKLHVQKLKLVPESVIMPLKIVPILMKHVQSMSSSVTPVRQYGNSASGYESYILAVHSEQTNSTQRNVPKPLEKRGPPDPTVVQSHSELSISTNLSLSEIN